MKNYFKPIAYLLLVHVLGLLIFTLFRVILFCTFDAEISSLHDVAKAFLIGIQFDNVMASTIVLIPLAVLGFAASFGCYNKRMFKIITVFLCVLYCISFLASAANIPYFQYFFKTLNASIWNWLDEPSFVVGMITQEASYMLYLALFALLAVAFCFAVVKIEHHFTNSISNKETQLSSRTILLRFFVTLILIGLAVCGFRGRLSTKSSIRIGTSYFCGNLFLNQLGQNPAYVLIRSTMDLSKVERKKINLMDEQTAITNARNWLNVNEENATNETPISRRVAGDKLGSQRNVVFILMESMASHFVADTSLTPFVNKMISKSLYFPNAYSAGIHTMNALCGSLLSFPALLEFHPFKYNGIKSHNSCLKHLQKAGYTTMYFTTHDAQFDNVGGYFFANNVEKLISQKEYPLLEVRSNLGVPDKFMFEFSIPLLNAEAESGEPFFVTFLTASNHAPYIIPDDFTPRRSEKRYQVIEFADYSLQRFFEMAEQQSWYNNTIFVLMGDHGAATNDYDISLTYHHVPLMIFDPQNPCGSVNTNMAAQLDVMPTIMGLLNLEYVNNGFGIDLLHDRRSKVFFSADNAYCCIDSVDYYVCRTSGDESMFDYRSHSQENFIEQKRAKADSMRVYTESMMQAAQSMEVNGFGEKLN